LPVSATDLFSATAVDNQRFDYFYQYHVIFNYLALQRNGEEHGKIHGKISSSGQVLFMINEVFSCFFTFSLP
jgi:hypothetical protein